MARPGIVGALIFIALCCLVLPYPGVHTDEALFGASLYHSAGMRDMFRAFGHDVPTMVMVYIGALKTWLYAPIFAVWAPSVWSIRLPMVLLGAATIALFARFLEEAYGRRAAWGATLLLATDASLVMTTTFDWGPVALQHFLFVAAVWAFWRFHREGRWWMVALGSFCCGLALWNKAVFAWTLIGGGLAVLLVFGRRLWTLAAWRAVAIALVFFLGGASMLIRYNVRSKGATWAMNSGMMPKNITDKHIHVRSMLDGSGVLGYIVREDNYGAIRWSVMPYVMAGAALLALARWRAGTLFPVLAAGLTWLVMAMTKDGGGSIHHAILLYPMLHWTLAASIGTMERGGRWVLLAAALLAADNARLVWVHRDNAQRLGGGKVWTEAIFPLAGRIAELQPKVIRIPDWGMQDNLIVLTQRELPVSSPAQPFDETLFTDYPEALWVGAMEERIPGLQKSLREAAEKYGYEKAVREWICDKRGQAQFELYEYRKIRR